MKEPHIAINGLALTRAEVMKEPKSEVLRVRVEPELFDAIRQAAERNGRTVSNMARWLLLAGLNAQESRNE